MFTPSFLTANDKSGAYPSSYYAATANKTEHFVELDGDQVCDVVVVGGGFTGLSSALHLAERGYSVVLLEAHRVGWGASGRNGGQVGSGQRREQDDLEKMVGRDDARKLWDIAEQSKDIVKSLISKHDIKCDWKPGILHADHRERFVAGTHEYTEKLRTEYGYGAIRAVGRDEIRDMLGSDFYHGGSLDMEAGHLHPLNFALGLADAARAAGARIFENATVTGYENVEKVVVTTAGGHRVTADMMVLGCNGYLDGLEDRVARRVMPINNFVIATEPLGDDLARELIRDDVAVADSKFVINYYRLSADKRMLFGGGETYSYHFPKDIKSFVAPYMLEVYPQLKDVKIDYGWGGTLAITMNRMPFFRKVEDRVYTATGYSGHGVAMATLAGQIMADAISGTMDRFDVMSNIKIPSFPGGKALRYPFLVLAMTWYSIRDRL
ncbi:MULTISPECIES: FAD-binding oxidoreductase [Thalassospira]|uniref:NAD(P)/FAD-dependent oxidoreductase n=1 Tax=Thalassospira TaxID=168934 RepID=UPI0008DC659E|nr:MULTISPECIES: FAD-binding oxidoreductase [Thalassospira]MAB31671.1 FAD-binding oxidoreductase [Thalassospira sp.]MDM7975630.1 FAD-binding oxidoreductase [Thalassospira xiamenensis]OHZ00627.1 oxidoreductase [Thalassospira sp. MIT1004]HBS24606.1 FAD-binding oxidoreductase [Thalassospira sp.]